MTLLEQYTNISEQHGLPTMIACGCEISTQPHPSAEAAWNALQDARPVAGWFQCQSEQRSFIDTLPESLDDWGALLAAEVVAADGDSLRIEYHNGTWQETRYHHRDDGDLLCDEVRQFLHHGGRLVYRRYWQQKGEQGWVQSHACLTGIDAKAKED